MGRPLEDVDALLVTWRASSLEVRIVCVDALCEFLPLDLPVFAWPAGHQRALLRVQLLTLTPTFSFSFLNGSLLCSRWASSGSPWENLGVLPDTQNHLREHDVPLPLWLSLKNDVQLGSAALVAAPCPQATHRHSIPHARELALMDHRPLMAGVSTSGESAPLHAAGDAEQLTHASTPSGAFRLPVKP